jgi:hypothetical protein
MVCGCRSSFDGARMDLLWYGSKCTLSYRFTCRRLLREFPPQLVLPAALYEGNPCKRSSHVHDEIFSFQCVVFEMLMELKKQSAHSLTHSLLLAFIGVAMGSLTHFYSEHLTFIGTW